MTRSSKRNNRCVREYAAAMADKPRPQNRRRNRLFFLTAVAVLMTLALLLA